MENKLYSVSGDFNLNCLEFHQISEIRSFLSNEFEKGSIAFINRPTRVTDSSTTLTHIAFMNCIFNTYLNKE